MATNFVQRVRQVVRGEIRDENEAVQTKRRQRFLEAPEGQSVENFEAVHTVLDKRKGKLR